ncbi:Nicotinamide-nucleotide amidohydrolase PncC [Paraconexibacter sp. AEG42_29]|uniref:Nicotinamide-nucleotide amidohydrolase PncC n=1 Tax=Paraconexibacter sp. AEG42_29 TaxID=2997339 RepID=A0AAU7B053_9ACTN
MLTDDLTTAAATVASSLIARGHSIAVTESSAGGLISASLLSVGGASAYYRGGVVVYTLEGARASIGGVVPLNPGVRSASEPFAQYLAASAAAKFGTEWAIGETGAAGPGGNPYGDPAGHAWLAVAGPDGAGATEHVLTGSEDRVANMQAFALRALRLLAAQLG